jgi:hypothetical protein
MSCALDDTTIPTAAPVETPKRRRPPPKLRPLITRDQRRDGRLAITKRFDAVVSAITADMSAVRLSTMQKAMIDAFAGCSVKLDNLTARLLLGEDVDLVEYTTAATTMVRLSQRLAVQSWEELKRMETS